MNSNETYEKELSFQVDRRRATVELIKIISDLWYDKTVELEDYKLENSCRKQEWVSKCD